jgi:hypothetical protein
MLEDDATRSPEESELELIKYLAGMVYIAGTDTLVTAVTSFFLAMLVYPAVQATAQAEIDRVVGKERLPELSDAPNMPYVQSVVNECLRWLPALTMGLSFSLLSQATSLICGSFQACRMRQARKMSITATSFLKELSSWVPSGECYIHSLRRNTKTLF